MCLCSQSITVLCRPGKPLLDAMISWRTFYVTLALVIIMLGNMQVRSSSSEDGRTAHRFCEEVSAHCARPLVAVVSRPYGLLCTQR
jgi:hypothetical protein